MIVRLLPVFIAALALPAAGMSQQKPSCAPPFTDPSITVPKLASLIARPSSELADVVARFNTDQTSLSRRYDALLPPVPAPAAARRTS